LDRFPTLQVRTEAYSEFRVSSEEVEGQAVLY
jgi:hypothetical protein